MVGVDVTSILVDFIRRIETRLSIDVREALKKAYRENKDKALDVVYHAMLSNISIAEEKGLPLCQDTGTLMFFIKAGIRSPHIALLKNKIVEAVKIATKTIPLRPNAVNPLTNNNSGNNIGRYVPWIHWDELIDNDVVEIGLYVAGGGSSFPGRAQVFKPLTGWENMVNLVFKVVAEYGVNACPPLVIGIGIGPTMEVAAVLSKKALFRRIGEKHDDERIARLEETLLEKLNKLEIGPQGLRGRNGILDVHIEYGYRHPATFAVGVSISCWALRRGVLVLYPSNEYKFLDYW